MLQIKGMIAGVLVAFLVASAATGLAYERFIVPEREALAAAGAAASAAAAAEAQAAALARIAAAESIAGELFRRQTAVNEAIASYQARLAADEAASAERIAQLEQENSDYARELRAAGRSCPYDDAIGRFLDGVSDIADKSGSGDGGGGGGTIGRVFGLN